MAMPTSKLWINITSLLLIFALGLGLGWFAYGYAVQDQNKAAPMTMVLVPNFERPLALSTPSLEHFATQNSTALASDVKTEPAPSSTPILIKQPEPQTSQDIPDLIPIWKKGETGQRRWQQNALTFTPDPTKPMVVIVIDDMGVSHKYSKQITALPGPLTLSYLPYAEDVNTQSQAAKAKGHELMLHLPMQPTKEDGTTVKDTLRITQSDAENLELTRNALGKLEGIVGVNNHTGSLFTSSPKNLAPILEEIARHGYLFLDSKTSQHAVGDVIAKKLGQPPLVRDVFLDHYDNTTDIKKALAQTIRVAKRQGYAIAIGHPKANTIKALGPWLETLDTEGVQLVPLSVVAKKL